MFFLLILLLIFVLGMSFFILFSVTVLISDLFLDLPYVGASPKRIDTILKLANVQKGERVVDLGSGDGRLLFQFAKKGATATGYELNLFLYLYSKFRTQKLASKIKIKRQSFWSADLKSQDIILVYSLKKYMNQFEDYIWKNGNKGTKVVVNTNPFPNKKPLKKEKGIFLYVI